MRTVSGPGDLPIPRTAHGMALAVRWHASRATLPTRSNRAVFSRWVGMFN